MQTWNFVDKADWPHRGPWDNEPDKAHWVDASTGLDCLIHRGPSGALCGYVGVPESSPHFKKDCDEVKADVHGGLTFADVCSGTNENGRGICHPEHGAANEVVWWLGFDCAHLGDRCPSYDSGYGGTYKSFDYVKHEVESLAAQLSSPQPASTK
jgi:hypothetical protein